MKTKTTNEQTKIETHLAALVAKFDRLSPEGKQRMVDSFDDKGTRERIEKQLGQPLEGFNKELYLEIKGYFQTRLPGGVQ